MLNIDYIENLDLYFTSPKVENHLRPPVYIFVVPSYETESPLDYFIESLKETYNDFRVDSRPLERIAGFSVFGIGDEESWPEVDKFCYQAFELDKYVGKLGARRLFPVGTGCVKTTLDNEVKSWTQDLLSTLSEDLPLPEPGDIVDSDDESETEDSSQNNSSLVDVEDIGSSIEATKSLERILPSPSNHKGDGFKRIAHAKLSRSKVIPLLVLTQVSKFVDGLNRH